MLNPSYLIQSRHNIFYFRYPLGQKRVCVSLNTRCPKEALRLAKFLEYHSAAAIKRMEREGMNHADIMAVMKTYYAALLEREKAIIDADGPMPKEKVARYRESLRLWGEIIEAGEDDVFGLLGVEPENPDDKPTKQDLKKIMDHTGLNFAPNSKEYGMMRDANKHVKRNFMQDLLTYNSNVTDFTFLQAASGGSPSNNIKSGHKLGSVMDAYLSEIKPTLIVRSYNEQRDCLKFLTDWLGADYQLSKLDDSKAREAKELVRSTPNHRNKMGLTKGHDLMTQISIAQQHNLQTLSTTSINKYLGYFGSFFAWAKRNKYVQDNPFFGMRVKAAAKKNSRRQMFAKDEVLKIANNLGNSDLVKNKSNYWGAMIAIYTGARRNEIAALLPEDVKRDEASGIWYFDITDEQEEGKVLKTESAKRVVPIHSKLLEKGFLKFVDESRLKQGKTKHKDGYEPRLLYDLTFTEHEKWGRNLGRWFNGHYLKKIGLKTPKKTLHSLRHSFITHLNMAGVEVSTIMSLAGHEPDTVHIESYTHYGVGHLPNFQTSIEKLPY